MGTKIFKRMRALAKVSLLFLAVLLVVKLCASSINTSVALAQDPGASPETPKAGGSAAGSAFPSLLPPDSAIVRLNQN